MRPSRIIAIAALALSLVIVAVTPIDARPDRPSAPDAPSAIEVADTATAPESAGAPRHAVDWNPAPDICSWLRAVWFPGWAKWSSSNQSPFNDPVVQCIYYRVTNTVEFACVWYRRLHAHETRRIHPPDPCVDLVSFAFP